jgi:hypothetical protein
MQVCEHCADCKFSEPNCNLEVHGEVLQLAADLSFLPKNKLFTQLFADRQGTDSGSFAKMIELLSQPARP